MKNQYFADIGDYGKYGLLIFLANKEINIAVNWYLTIDDDPPTNDGHFRGYLDDKKKNEYIQYNEDLYNKLREMHKQKLYSVEAFEKQNMISNAKYFHEYIDSTDWNSQPAKNRLAKRLRWHNDAMDLCGGSELVFLDPDNGLSKNDVNGRKISKKYAFLDEAYDYYQSGSDVVYYCHKGRRKKDQWENAIMVLQAKDPLIHIKAISFHKGTQRTFVFAIHPERAKKYDCILHEFLQTNWGRDGLFTNEF